MKQWIERYNETNKNLVLLDAPCLVVSMTDKRDYLSGRDSSVMAMMVTQLYAPVIGIGTCWAGVVEVTLFAGYQPLLDLLKLPENMRATGAMMLGYPKYEHRRIPDRNTLQILWCNEE